ncbi:TatD family hydrolase [Thiomicrorhabdus sediminis]|uniref:TatD family deoxyribonuclease n=1 Tax=Thiomicrorhabdus sediminis TaxID=2580412 RepID=A0A4P9K4L2_9GAMM|nr:TatD family hydrolase [Thiomicrorhabdus sediminis]QCU89895.1 TatD family deoxyribonuclease [Thiomicrorhabdus sediminis]
MIIDSHCHLNILPEDKVGSVEEVLANAKELGVEKVLCVAINPEQWHEVIALAEKHPQVYASIGVHPCEDKEVVVTDEQLIEAASHPKVLAIGEVGLDYFHFENEPDMSWQHERFKQHIRIAKQLDKPLIIHTRNSTPDCLSILEQEGADEVGGIMHCFVEDMATAERAMAINFYISFSGIVTFKNAKELKEVAAQMPLDRILVETDSPYLAPVPYRGKTNQPGYTHYVVQEIADLKALPFESVAQATTDNFNRLFKQAS